MTENVPLSETTDDKKLRPKQIGCLCLALGLAALLVSAAVYFFVLRSVPLKISKETTYVTQPLKPGGKHVDYLAAWEQEFSPKDIATDENGYRLIVKHLGMTSDALPFQSPLICQKLGLPDTSQPDMKLEEPYPFLSAYVESDAFDPKLVEMLREPSDGFEGFEDQREPLDILYDRLGTPWTLDDLPMMETWLKENSPAIDLIGEAAAKPTFHIPLTPATTGPLIGMFVPELPRLRNFARVLCTRARYRIATGDIDGAINDIVACKRLGRHIGHGGTLVQLLVGVAVEGMADSIRIAGSLDHPPTRKQLERLVDEWNQLPPRVKIEKPLLFERYSTLDTLQFIAGNRQVLADMQLPVNVSLHAGLDWNVIAQRVNQHYGALPGGGGVPQPAPNPMAIISLQARSEMIGDAFSAYCLPAADATVEALRRATCTDRLHHIALAMLLYERDHETLPPAFTAEADGKRLHSCQVLLLPYLGQKGLYDKIHLDEPWNSDHNRQFHNEAIPFYQCPSEQLAPGHTTYSVVVGPDMPFDADQGKPLSHFGANMILVVEIPQAACWMDPSHYVSQAAAERGIGEGTSLGSQHPGGLNAAFRDGSARFLSETIDLGLLKRTTAGNGRSRSMSRSPDSGLPLPAQPFGVRGLVIAFFQQTCSNWGA